MCVIPLCTVICKAEWDTFVEALYVSASVKMCHDKMSHCGLSSCVWSSNFAGWTLWHRYCKCKVFLLCAVNLHVFGKCSFLLESFPTDTTSVRSLYTVFPHVCSQGTSLGEISFTNIARVRSFSTVYIHMYFQGTFISKSFFHRYCKYKV